MRIERLIPERELRPRLLACLPEDRPWGIKAQVSLAAIYGCLKDGADLERHVLPAIRSEAANVKANGRHLGKWENLTPAIMAAYYRERDARAEQASRPSSRSAVDPMRYGTAEQWIERCRRYRQDDDWSTFRSTTPPPDDPRCALPDEILVAAGYEPKTRAA